MSAFDRYGGDPRIVIDPDGADLDYKGGQPVMDQGFENCALLSLFTQEGWVGNIFLSTDNKVGSDFQKTAQGTLTLSRLADIENSASRALSSKVFGSVSAEASNPQGDRVSVVITIGSGGALSLTREKALWTMQTLYPASRRISS
jgi:hypothetical protein